MKPHFVVIAAVAKEGTRQRQLTACLCNQSIFPTFLFMALMEIHDVVVALQNTATTTSQFLEEKGMYSDDEVPDPFYRGILMKIQLMIVIKTWTTTTVTMSDPHEHHIQPAKLSDAM
ncbi:hypothetical protein VPH35_122986 [Triticum aestivum]